MCYLGVFKASGRFERRSIFACVLPAHLPHYRRWPNRMKISSLLSAVFVSLALYGCTGSGSATGGEALGKFRSSTGVFIPTSIAEGEYKWVHVRDSFAEYFKLACDQETAQEILASLSLSDSGTVFKSANDPDWWVLPSRSVSFEHSYSERSGGRKTYSWYDSNIGALFTKVSRWY